MNNEDLNDNNKSLIEKVVTFPIDTNWKRN